MQELTKSTVARKILELVTGSTQSPYRLLPERRSDAPTYLRSCLKLYLPQGDAEATEDRVAHLNKFLELLQVLAGKERKPIDHERLARGDWPQDADAPDRDVVVVALQILSLEEKEYCEAVMAYLCEKTTTLLNATGDPRRNDKLAVLDDCLSPPLVFEMAHIRSLGQCIRALPGTPEDRVEAIQALVRFWQKTPEVTQTGKADDIGRWLTGLAGGSHGTSGGLVIDLVSTFRKSVDYCEDAVALLSSACVTRCQGEPSLGVWPNYIPVYRQVAEVLLAFVNTEAGDCMGRFRDHVLSGLLSIPGIAGTSQNRQGLADACRAIYDAPPDGGEKSSRLQHLQVMKDLAGIAGLEPKAWKDALADACRSDEPDPKMKEYLHGLLYRLLEVTSGAAGSHGPSGRGAVPKDVGLVLSKCAEGELRDSDLLDAVVDRLLRDINGKAVMGDYDEYLSRGLWLATAFDRNALCRRCTGRMSEYRLLRPKDHWRAHLGTVLRLLRSDTYTGTGPERMKREIEELFRLDTYDFPASAAGRKPDEVQSHKNDNLKVCQDVKEMLDSRK